MSGGVIEGNTLYNNGTPGSGAGILVVGSDNRIEGNNCIGADFGIKVDGAGNIILRNTCSGNTTNWSLVANNVYRNQPGDFVVLEVDTDRVTAPVRFEAPVPPPPAGHPLAGHLFPHIYGPIDRDAIVAIKPVTRAPDGAFVF